MKKITLAAVLILLLCTKVCFAQTKSTWTVVGDEKSVRTKPNRKTVPSAYQVVKLDMEALRDKLKLASVRNDNGGLSNPIPVDFPMEDGTFESFNMEKTHTMEAGLEALYPQITTYYGVSKRNPLNKIFITLGPRGFDGLITGEKVIYLDPFNFFNNGDNYIVYSRKDCKRSPMDDFACNTKDETGGMLLRSFDPGTISQNVTDGKFRTYRIAIATTSEYSNYYGNDMATILNAITTTINRVNSVYRFEVAVKFLIVADESKLVFINNVNSTGVTDPYDNYDGGTNPTGMLYVNTGNINNIIGSAAYDIGHVFSTGGGGIAGTGPCTTTKGRGVTGIVTPQYDPFDIDYVCHEIGHQFGASHTYYNACFGSKVSTDYEPGSASTIMGYAGVCAPNIQDNSDAYFHAISINQMAATIASTTCDIETAYTNTAPTVATNGTAFSIPKGTPFILDGTGTTDAQTSSGDVLTYCWEEYETGDGATMPPVGANTVGPQFRSFFPTTNPTRTFPNRADVFNNVTPMWEVLPTVARTMKFRLTVRDNNTNVPLTKTSGDVTITVVDVTPLSVTAPNTAVTWYVGESKTVTWSTGTSTYAANVSIEITNDNGLTYTTLLASTPNDGSQAITVPDMVGTHNRIRVKAVGNIFFDVSNVDFTIKANSFEFSGGTIATSCKPANASLGITYTPATIFSGTTTFSLTGLPAGATYAFSPASVTGSTATNVTLTISGLSSVAANYYDISVKGTSGSTVISYPVTLKVFDNSIGTVSLVAPVNGAGNQQTSSLLKWNTLISASSYIVEVSTDPLFSTIAETATVTSTSYQTTQLVQGNVYFWRVKPINPCLSGTYSEVYSFQIAIDTCVTYANKYFEFNDNIWDENSNNAVSARVDVPDNIQISKVSFYMKAAHEAVVDLKMQFSGPTGLFVEVYNRDCSAGANLDVTFDDNGAALPAGCSASSPALGGTKKTAQALSKFNGSYSQGTWVLLATDRGSNASGGTFQDFSVTICGKLQYVNNITVTKNTLMLNSGLTATISAIKLTASQPSVAATGLTYIITKLPLTGVLKKSGTALTVGQSFTQADINNNLITYSHNGANANPDSFTFSVKGGNTALNGGQVFSINICGVTATATQTNVLCYGAATGSATVTPTGGTAPYTYLWSPSGGSGATASNLAAATYTCTVTDAGGCTYNQAVTITQPAAALTATTSTTNIACFGGNTGSASVTASGGTASYTYLWSPSGGNGATATGLTAGNYTCTITDSNGCSLVKNFTIAQPAAALTATTSTTNIACFGGNTGSASVTASGGTASYSYSWSPSGGNGPTANGLTAGNYTCTITDSNGCSLIKNFTIAQPAAALTATTSTTNIACFGGNTGAASVTASGGTASYSYSWSPSGGNAATATGLTAGNYTCTITDSNGCSLIKNFTIAQPAAALTATTSTTNIACFGGNTGSASVTVSGGTASYSYSWSPSGGNAATATGLTAGNYTCTITDSNGCSLIKNFTIAQPAAALTATTSTTNIACFGGNTGSASVTASGGTASYTYSWSPSGGNGATANGLVAGNYTCTITDSNGCSLIKNFTIAQPAAALTATTSTTNIACFGGNTGAASVTVSGGTASYSYSWSPSGGTGPTASGLTAGNYTCTITDSNGCSLIKNFTIAQPAILNATVNAQNVSCYGQSNASAVINVTGGTAPYSYTWSAPANTGNTATATNLAPGSYTCTVTDAKGCSTVKNFSVTQPGITTYNNGVWSAGPPTAGMRAVIETDFTSTGDLQACELFVNGNAVVLVQPGHDFTISSKVVVAPTANLTFANNANLLQDAAYTGTGINTGNVVVKRDAKMWRQDYVYWGSPVSGQNLKAFSPATLESRFYVYNEPTNEFKPVFSPTGYNQLPANYNFEPGKGYMVRAPNTFPNPTSQGAAPITTFNGVFTGIPNNGNVGVAVANSGLNFGFNLIANPYPSVLNGHDFLLTNPGTLYFWNHHDQVSGNAVNYATYNLSGGTVPGYAGAIAPDGSIAVGQGFLYLNQNSISTAQFTNAMRSGNNSSQFYRTASTGMNRIWLNLAKGDVAQNQMLVNYMQGATLGVDTSYDGALITGGNAISSLIGPDKFVIQARPEFEPTDIVPMYFNATEAGNFTINLDHVDGLFDGAQDIFLQDNQLGIVHNLKTGPYNFAAGAGAVTDRFQLVYQASPLANPEFESNHVILYKQHNIFNIDSGAMRMKQVQIFDIRGRLIYTKADVNASTVALEDLRAEQGVLLIQITNTEGLKITKKAVY